MQIMKVKLDFCETYRKSTKTSTGKNFDQQIYRQNDSTKRELREILEKRKKKREKKREEKRE